MITEINCLYETTESPVAGVTAQSKQIVVEAFNWFLLQHVVHPVATIQPADGIVFIQWWLRCYGHYTHHTSCFIHLTVSFTLMHQAIPSLPRACRIDLWSSVRFWLLNNCGFQFDISVGLVLLKTMILVQNLYEFVLFGFIRNYRVHTECNIPAFHLRGVS